MKGRFWRSLGPVVTVFLLTGHSANGAVPSADEILARVDSIRMPPGDNLLKVRIEIRRTGRSNQTAAYEVLLKGLNRTVIKTMTPATDRGTSFLLIDHDLWIFLPDVSKPVRLSLQQRLLGEIANGDLARVNFVGDYRASLDQVTADAYILKLVAKTEEVTYGSVILVVDKKTFRPVSAKFFAISGRLLKQGSYEDYRRIAGDIRPTRLVFTDPLAKGKASVIFYDSMIPQENLPDKVFTKDYLKKLKY